MPWRNPDASSAVIAENLGWISSGLKWRVGRRSGGGGEGRRKKTQQQRDPLPMPSGYLAVQDLPQPGKEGGEAGRGGWRGGGQAEGGRRSPAPGGPRSPAGTPQPWGWAWLPHPQLVIIIVINY